MKLSYGVATHNHSITTWFHWIWWNFEWRYTQVNNLQCGEFTRELIFDESLYMVNILVKHHNKEISDWIFICYNRCTSINMLPRSPFSFITIQSLASKKNDPQSSIWHPAHSPHFLHLIPKTQILCVYQCK